MKHWLGDRKFRRCQTIYCNKFISVDRNLKYTSNEYHNVMREKAFWSSVNGRRNTTTSGDLKQFGYSSSIQIQPHFHYCASLIFLLERK